jgi:hypothetical protein
VSPLRTSSAETTHRSCDPVRWLWVVGWIALIYTTIPFVRVLQGWFTARWDKALIGYAVIAVIVVSAVAVAASLRHLTARPSRGAVLWLMVVAAVFTWWAVSLRQVPEEAVHLLEYGVLGVLLYRAIRPRIEDVTVYLVAALIGLLVGIVDEVIQWITPGRFFDFRDIFLNGGSCGLALVGVWRIEGPGPRPVTVRSMRRVVRWAGAAVALFTVVLSATPTRVQRWADRLPTVGFLQSPDNEMAEYGHRHLIPGVGRFKSRLTIAQLRAEDAARADEVASILDRYPDRRYGRFLRDVPPQLDPFAHEARVHISSRDHHLRMWKQQPEGSQEARRHASIALRQHQILERSFGSTLRSSSYDLAPDTVEHLERQSLPGFLWTSATSRHLITWISETALRVALIAILAGLAAVHRKLGVPGGRIRRRTDAGGDR